jgi:hypothetical protein
MQNMVCHALTCFASVYKVVGHPRVTRTARDAPNVCESIGMASSVNCSSIILSSWSLMRGCADPRSELGAHNTSRCLTEAHEVYFNERFGFGTRCILPKPVNQLDSAITSTTQQRYRTIANVVLTTPSPA